MKRDTMLVWMLLLGIIASGLCDTTKVAADDEVNARRALRNSGCKELPPFEPCGDDTGDWEGVCCPPDQECTQTPSPGYKQCVPPGYDFGGDSSDPAVSCYVATYGAEGKTCAPPETAEGCFKRDDIEAFDDKALCCRASFGESPEEDVLCDPSGAPETCYKIDFQGAQCVEAASVECYQLFSYVDMANCKTALEAKTAKSAAAFDRRHDRSHGIAKRRDTYRKDTHHGRVKLHDTYGRVAHHEMVKQRDTNRKDARTNAFSGCTQLAAYAQCGDDKGEYKGKCCPSGQSCTPKPDNKYYRQCVPPGHFGGSAAPAANCQKLAEWAPCGAKGQWTNVCCPATQVCTRQPGNDWYMQCVPPGYKWPKKDATRHDTRYSMASGRDSRRMDSRRMDSRRMDSRTRFDYKTEAIDCEVIDHHAQCGEEEQWEDACCAYGWECVAIGENATTMQCNPAAPTGDPYEVTFYNQCGGIGVYNMDVEPVDGPYPDYFCQAGATCTRQTEWFWDCVPDPVENGSDKARRYRKDGTHRP